MRETSREMLKSSLDVSGQFPMCDRASNGRLSLAAPICRSSGHTRARKLSSGPTCLRRQASSSGIVGLVVLKKAKTTMAMARKREAMGTALHPRRDQMLKAQRKRKIGTMMTAREVSSRWMKTGSKSRMDRAGSSGAGREVVHLQNVGAPLRKERQRERESFFPAYRVTPSGCQTSQSTTGKAPYSLLLPTMIRAPPPMLLAFLRLVQQILQLRQRDHLFWERSSEKTSSRQQTARSMGPHHQRPYPSLANPRTSRSAG